MQYTRPFAFVLVLFSVLALVEARSIPARRADLQARSHLPAPVVKQPALAAAPPAKAKKSSSKKGNSSSQNNSNNNGNNLGNNNSSSNSSSVDNNSNSSNSSSIDNSNSNNSSDSSSSSNNNSSSNNASSTSSASSATRTRPCDQGDQSLAAGLAANVVIGIGQQASVLTLQGVLGEGGNNVQSDFQTAVDRLNQFMNTSTLQIQMATTIADSGSFAQPQLALLQTELNSQNQLIGQLNPTANNVNDTLNQLLQSFQTSTGNSQDGANNAIIDCFLPTTAVSG